MKKRGFTLAELLIALAILGVIATFTIPKVLQSQQETKKRAMAKEAASMIAGAYDAYRLQNTPTSATKFGDLTPYMNYVKRDTVSTPDDVWGFSFADCSLAGRVCLGLHNGGILWSQNSVSFGGTDTTNAVWMNYDWNNEYSGSTNNTDKSVEFYLYYNGRIATKETKATNTCTSASCQNPVAGSDPAWFDWD